MMPEPRASTKRIIAMTNRGLSTGPPGHCVARPSLTAGSSGSKASKAFLTTARFKKGRL
jgi:hypothetical protein